MIKRCLVANDSHIVCIMCGVELPALSAMGTSMNMPLTKKPFLLFIIRSF